MMIRLLVLGLACLTVCEVVSSSSQFDASIYAEINADKETSWKAVETMTEARFDDLVGRLQRAPQRPFTRPDVSPNAGTSYTSLPASFDARYMWPHCIHPVLNQGDCGSCWAFASSEVLSDRFCIYSGGKVNVVLSPQNLLSCEDLNLGCSMGSLPGWAWSFLHKTGITTMDCVPYVNGDGGKVPPCQTECTSNNATSTSEAFTHYHAENYTHVGDLLDPSNHVNEIMSAVLQGPVDALFNVFADFVGYESGVYVHKTGSYQGLHNVKVIGYGVESGVPYWLVQNSWGTDWGMDGYFKILRGVNECGFERDMYTGFPLLS